MAVPDDLFPLTALDVGTMFPCGLRTTAATRSPVRVSITSRKVFRPTSRPRVTSRVPSGRGAPRKTGSQRASDPANPVAPAYVPSRRIPPLWYDADFG